MLSIILNQREHIHLCHYPFFLWYSDDKVTRIYNTCFVGHSFPQDVLNTSPLYLHSFCISLRSCQHCSNHFWEEWDFYLPYSWVIMWGYEEKKMKMKIEDARKKLEDWRWVGWSGLGWKSWTTFMFIIIQHSSSRILAMATVHSKLARTSVVLTKALCHRGEAADTTLVSSCGILLGFEKAGLACLPPISTNRM